MENDLGRNIQVYVFNTIRVAKKQADEYYKNKFDPFHKWIIGKLIGEEIKTNILDYLKNGKNNNEHRKTAELIETLKETIENYFKTKYDFDEKIESDNKKILNLLKTSASELKDSDWLKIRVKYQQLKNQKFEDEKIKTLLLPEKQKDEEPTLSLESLRENDIAQDYRETFHDTDYINNLQFEIFTKLKQLSKCDNWEIKIYENFDEKTSYNFDIIIYDESNLSSFYANYVNELKEIVSDNCINYRIFEKNLNNRNCIMIKLNLLDDLKLS